MKPVPDQEITGTVVRFNLDPDIDGGAVLVVYAEDEHGTIGYGWIRFDRAATRALKYRLAKLDDIPTERPAAPPATDREAAAEPSRRVSAPGRLGPRGKDVR
ncbi:hypothetical protein ACIPSE_45135 [Streptomyces sp. NPDC090106]|uniref:hypothetical protein n=1 Tax=Streptomyces sp. NPDC090106 TaxID=3365946 RepID=UPI0038138F9F